MKAALFVAGRVVTGDTHMACLQGLTDAEIDGADSGFVDCESGRFISEREGAVFGDKELYFVRHGQATHPEEPDPDISPEGEAQARRAAACLAAQDLKSFEGFVSPLLRCLRTATVLHRALGINFHVVPELMETPPGEIFKVQSRATAFPQFDWPVQSEWCVEPETPHDFYDRVKESLRRFPDHSIVVTHFGYICLTAKIALCKGVLKEGFPPASVTYFHGADGQRLGWTDAEIHEDRPAAADRKAG